MATSEVLEWLSWAWNMVVQSAHAAWRCTLSASILSSMLSALVSIYVAWKVFKWQSQKDRAAWIRDQQKTEWSAILSKLTDVDDAMPSVFIGEDWLTLTDGLLHKLRSVLTSLRNSLFISEELEKEGTIGSFQTFVGEAAEKIGNIHDHTKQIAVAQTVPLGWPDAVDDVAARNRVVIGKQNRRELVYLELYNQFHKEAARMRLFARACLMSKTPRKL